MYAGAWPLRFNSASAERARKHDQMSPTVKKHDSRMREMKRAYFFIFTFRSFLFIFTSLTGFRKEATQAQETARETENRYVTVMTQSSHSTFHH